ncbi:MAG: radical SAM protein [Candidatus Omnitrophota bacterium]
MCYAIPGKLVEKTDTTGVVDYFGEKRKVRLAFMDVKEGDYVYAQGGVLINRISEKEALESLETWKELFFELKKIDRKLSGAPEIPTKTPDNMLAILQKVNLGKELTREELAALLNVEDQQQSKLIYDTANNIRQKDQDNACCVHGIIEFSNLCRNDCLYCGIRKSSMLERYEMSPDEIIKTAEYAVKELGFKALVLQSGENPNYDEDKLAYIVRKIKDFGILVFLSVGSRDKEIYRKLYEEGARAALLRFETSDKGIFEELRPETDFDERLGLIKYIKELGYVLATGFIVGFPGENTDTVIDNILLTRSLQPDMYSFGPFIPAGNTPLGDHSLPDKDKILKVISACRFVDKNAKILVTTALETLDKKAKREALLAGANSLMINVTPPHLRKLYNIYDSRVGTDSEAKDIIGETLDLLYSLGRAPTDLGI